MRRAFERARKKRPRRGRPLPKRERVYFPPEQLAGPHAPAAAANPDELPPVDAPRVDPAPVEHEPPVPSAPVPPARELEPAAAPPHPRGAAWRLGLTGAVLLVAFVVLSVGANLGGPGATGPTREARSEPPLPSTSPAPGSTDGGVHGHEVALAPKPLDSVPEGDAAPVGAPLPASTANAMPRTSAQSPKNETPKPQPKRPGFTLPAVVAACSLVDGGCTAPASQVRPEPPAITCPQDWRETHKRFKFYNLPDGPGMATVQGYTGEVGEHARVKDGPAVLEVPGPTSVSVGGVGDLPAGTLLLGQWQLGDNRLFGTFTEARIPGVGTLPVCLVAGEEIDGTYPGERGGEYICPPGLGACLSPESTPGNARTPTRVGLVEPRGQPK